MAESASSHDNPGGSDDRVAVAPPAEDLPVTVEAPTASCRVVVPFGEIDAHTAPALRTAILSQLDIPETEQLVVDLSRTSFLDSSALGVLIGALKRVRESGGQFDVVLPPSPVRRIFEITALDRVLDLHETREEALASRD
jgi:anti-sigma B factor antagonist